MSLFGGLKGCIVHGTDVPYLHNKYELHCCWCYRKYVYFWRIRGLAYRKYLRDVSFDIGKDSKIYSFLKHKGN